MFITCEKCNHEHAYKFTESDAVIKFCPKCNWRDIYKSYKQPKSNQSIDNLCLLDITDKAKLWDTLMSCGRIRCLGSGSLGKAGQQHIGLELWVTFPEDIDNQAAKRALLIFLKTMINEDRNGKN